MAVTAVSWKQRTLVWSRLHSIDEIQTCTWTLKFWTLLKEICHFLRFIDSFGINANLSRSGGNRSGPAAHSSACRRCFGWTLFYIQRWGTFCCTLSLLCLPLWIIKESRKTKSWGRRKEAAIFLCSSTPNLLFLFSFFLFSVVLFFSWPGKSADRVTLPLSFYSLRPSRFLFILSCSYSPFSSHSSLLLFHSEWFFFLLFIVRPCFLCDRHSHRPGKLWRTIEQRNECEPNENEKSNEGGKWQKGIFRARGEKGKKKKKDPLVFDGWKSITPAWRWTSSFLFPL